MNRDPTYTNCYMYAFDRVHEDGGYIGFGYSTHWQVQHVAHYDNISQTLSQFKPPHDLKQPWYSLVGFNGRVVIGDKDFRKPQPVRIMYLGVFYLFLALTSWYIKRSWDKFKKVKGHDSH
ncbi:MAG: hypothetical protein JJD98_00080 [Polaromonas sp.]|nr:hypothetical protein [Polaromonas sp.]